MRPETNKVLAFELSDAVLRSWWTVVAGLCIGLAVGILWLANTPKIYEAATRILITPQTTKLVRTTVNSDPTRVLMALEEAVLSESYMRQLIEANYGLPETEEQLTSLIRRIRSRVSVRPMTTHQSGWLAFDIVFRDDNPRRCARVANSLAELYIAQTRDSRIVSAREMTGAQEERVADARAEFEKIDRELQDFRASHSFETESHLDANLKMLENAQNELENGQTGQTESRVRIKQYRVDLEELQGGRLTAAQRLGELNDELEALLISYSAQHPAVVRKKREIEEQKATASIEERRGQLQREEELPADPKARALLQQIAEEGRDILRLAAAETRLRGEIAEYQRRIQAVAAVQPQLTQLETLQRAAHKRLTDQQVQLDTAKESQFLEEGRQASQLELAERATAPRAPVSPIPQRFYALGVIGGLLLFVGPVVGWRFLNPPVSSEAGLRNIADVPVLVSIPRIPTQRFRRHAMKQFAKNLGLALVGVGVLAVVIATVVGVPLFLR